jgi:hypothetical protein
MSQVPAMIAEENNTSIADVSVRSRSCLPLNSPRSESATTWNRGKGKGKTSWTYQNCILELERQLAASAQTQAESIRNQAESAECHEAQIARLESTINHLAGLIQQRNSRTYSPRPLSETVEDPLVSDADLKQLLPLVKQVANVKQAASIDPKIQNTTKPYLTSNLQLHKSVLTERIQPLNNRTDPTFA